MARTVNCVKLGREADGLNFPPMPGELGKKLFESVSKEAWAQWIRMQTMIINENRLNLADAAHPEVSCRAGREALLRHRGRPGTGLRAAESLIRPAQTISPLARWDPAGFFARSPACGCWLPYAYLSSQRSSVS